MTDSPCRQFEERLLSLPKPDPLRTEPGEELARRLHAAVCRTMPPAGGVTLDAYSKAFGEGKPPVSPVILDWVEKESTRLYGADAAATLVRELSRRNAVQTANHLGPSFSAEFFQGDLLFALGCKETVPIFAYGGVPFLNVGFPRGVLIAPNLPGTLQPRKVPLLPRIGRRRFISSSPAVHPKDVDLPTGAIMTAEERAVMARIVERVYRNPKVLHQTSMRDQFATAGSELWSMAVGNVLPPVFMLDFETMIRDLVRSDLQDPDSLVSKVLLTPELAIEVRTELAETRGCWFLNPDGSLKRGALFFWAIDDETRAWSLDLSEDGRSLFRTEGAGPIDAEPWVRLTREDLTRALDDGRLQPALYLFVVSVAVTHGLNTGGGVYQIEYVPAMACGTRRALHAVGDHSDPYAESDFTTGMLPIGIRAPSTQSLLKTIPAGAFEVIARGGLKPETVAAMRGTTVRRAFLPALAYHYEDLVPEAERTDEWLASLAVPAPIVLDD